MPLITAAVLAYAAGLLAALSTMPLWFAAGGLLVVWQGARSPHNRIALLILGIAAWVGGRAAVRNKSDCEQRLRSAHAWTLTLASDAHPGDFSSARADCGASVGLAIARGSAVAGTRVSVRGNATITSRGILIDRAAITIDAPPSTLARWRAAVGRGIDTHFGQDAPLVRALLIADMKDLSPSVRDRFAAAGLSHMLSVSGLHVGLIAAAVALLAQAVGASRGQTSTIVVGLIAVYVAAIGAPLPAIRAAVMLAVYSLSTALQRPTSVWAVLAGGAALPLVDPAAVVDVGYQLSVIGMVALIASGSLAKRWSWLQPGGWRGTLRRSLVTSAFATLLTAPLVAATFGRVSIVAPLSNLVAAPVIAVLQPMLFLAAVLFPVPAAARFVAGACTPLLAAIDRIASAAATMPGASLAVVPDPFTSALALAAVLALAIAAVSRFPGRALVTAVACMAVMAWRPLVPLPTGATELHMIDVGQGDAIALRTARGRWVLIDAGRDWVGGDEGKRDVVPYLTRRGGDLVAFVLSHPHADHVGGAASALHALRPAYFYDPGYAGSTTSYRASLLEAERVRATWRRVRPGDSLVVDEATLTFLAPDSAWAESQSDPNLASSIVRIRVGNVAFLLTGDAEAPEERWLLDHASGSLRADVLKVAHHGSRTSTTDEFLDAVRPRLALVSVGAGNVYHHPSPSVMQSLATHGTLAMRTDLNGTIVVRTDGEHIEVESRGERWPVP